MRSRIKSIVSVIAALGMLVSFFAGCNTSSVSTSEVNEVIFCVHGEEPKDLGLVLERINEKLEKELNTRLKIRILNSENYNLIFSSGERFDIVVAPDWLGYWDNAAKGAFAEITDADLKNYAPYIAKQDKQYLNAGNIDGKRYAISSFEEEVRKSCYIVRGDIMEKYGIETIEGIEGFEVYLDAVAENESGMIPYDVSGSKSWTTAAMYYGNLPWVAPGASSFASPIFVSLNDETYTIFSTIEAEETREFTKKMKEWNEKGYWSRSAMSNKVDSVDSFKNGRSASAFGTLEELNDIYNEFQSDERKNWNVTGFPVYNKIARTVNAMNKAVAISASTIDKELALRTLDLIYSDKELYRLLKYGIEDIHYNIVGNNEKVTIDAAYGQMYTAISNDEYKLEEKLGFPGADRIKQAYLDAVQENPIRDYRRDLTNLTEIFASLNNIQSQYTSPRYLGFIEDVDVFIEREKQQLKEAGIDIYIETIQERLYEYLEEVGIK